MNGKEYQKLAMRTCSIPYDDKQGRLHHAVFGLASEAGEVAGIMQKVFQGHEFDKEHMKKELGDCLWMIAEACEALDFSMDDVMQLNIDKLKARHLMQAIKAYTQIFKDFEGQKVLQKLELVGRTCYKSEDKITEDSAAKFVAGLIKRGHEAMLEHVSITVKFVTDRGISHEIVRHRLASYAQESTRYCNYSQDKFGHELTFIIPDFLEYGSEGFKLWKNEMKQVEKTYFAMLEAGHTPQEARSVLPNSLKTELVMTANLREWRAFFKLRAANSTGAAHPQMLEITRPLLDDLKAMIPVVFDDITYEEKVVKEDGKE